MTLYSAFVCWLILNELFVLAVLGAPLTKKAASACGLAKFGPLRDV
ncbi:MAG: hypothetical protein ACXWKP_15440 [Bradyrhizobium sp.]